MSALPPTARAVLGGLVGGGAASLALVLPALLGLPATNRFAEYASLVIGLLAVHLGTRAPPAGGDSVGARLGRAALLVTTLAAVTGVSAYLLFAVWRPGLLAARYAAYEQEVRASGATAARIGHELARLAASRPEYLDPGYQALTGASTVFFFGMLLGAYGAWQLQVARRWRRPTAR